MAQTGYTPISLYYSTTGSQTPLAANLTNGELAINITDGKLYYKDNTGTVQLIASKAAVGGVTSITFGSTGLTPSVATGGVVSVGGTLGAGYGGTGNASYTIGDVLYATGSSSLGKLTLGASGYVLSAGATAPQYVAQSTLSVGTATNLAGGLANQIAYQTGPGATSFITAPTVASTILSWSGSAFTWAPAPSANIAVSNDTSTASNVYPAFLTTTTGTASTIYTGNANLLYKPSTGEFQALAPVALNGISINKTTAGSSYTIATNSNGLSVGPVAVSSGVSITITSGQRWVVL